MALFSFFVDNTMTVALMSKLDAVNAMLESVWERPVSTLNVSGIASVAMAVRMLDKVSTTVQSRGWSFNTDYQFPLTPDVNGNLNLPENTLFADPDGENKDLDYVQRGFRLYDRGNKTFTFPQGTGITITLISLLEFEDLPQTVRTYIAIQAARLFADKWLNRDSPASPTEEELDALRAIEDAEADAGDCNMFTDSWSVFSALDRGTYVFGQ